LHDTARHGFPFDGYDFIALMTAITPITTRRTLISLPPGSRRSPTPSVDHCKAAPVAAPMSPGDHR